VRQGRSEQRREMIDRRIDKVIERRRVAGLPVPDAEQEARLRERIEQAQTEREARNAQRIEARRETLRQRVENGDALTRENLVPGREPGAGALPDGRRLRDLSRQERREVLRNLPPEQRRALTEELRRWREQRAARPLPAEQAPTPPEPQSEAPAMSDPAVADPPL
jgi:hypothetical protein